MAACKLAVVILLLLCSAQTGCAETFYDVLGVSQDADVKDIEKAFRRLSKTYHPDKSSDPNATAAFVKISEAYQTLSDPEKREAYNEQLSLGPWADLAVKAQQSFNRVSETLVLRFNLQPFIDRWLQDENTDPNSMVCSTLRFVAGVPTRAMAFLELVLLPGDLSALLADQKAATIHWLDANVCSDPAELTQGVVVFFVSLLTPAAVLKPLWFLVGAMGYGACALATWAQMQHRWSESPPSNSFLAVLSAAHVNAGLAVALIPVALLGFCLRLLLGIAITAQTSVLVLLLGKPGFWFFVFSPIFFVSRLIMFNPFTAVPFIMFGVTGLLGGFGTMAVGLLKAWLVRTLQPFVLCGVFVAMMVKAAWVGAPSDLFSHFKWLWRFHAAVWALAWWLPAWALGIGLYGLQLTWAFLLSTKLLHSSGLPPPTPTPLVGGPYLRYAVLSVGLKGSFLFSLALLVLKALRAAKEWNEGRLQKLEEKRKMIEELGYEPLRASDLAKNPRLLQEQFQMRAQAKSKMQQRRRR